MIEPSKLPHPLKLAVQMLWYCVFGCDATQNLKASEIKKGLSFYFGEDLVEDASEVILGNHSVISKYEKPDDSMELNNAS